MTLIDIERNDDVPSRGAASRHAIPILVAVAALLATVGVAGGIRRGLAGRDAPAVPVFFDWPARGSLRNDTALIDEAIAVWDGEWGPPEIPRRRHTEVRILYAEQVDNRRIVLLQGRDYLGVPTLGVVWVPPRLGMDGWPHDVASAGVLNPYLNHEITFVMHTSITGEGSKVFVVSDPDTTTISWATSTDPDTLLPMYVVDGVGVADFHNRGIDRVVVAKAGGKRYDGPPYPLPGVGFDTSVPPPGR